MKSPKDSLSEAESTSSRSLNLLDHPPFKLGVLTVRPSSREIEGPGFIETIEPRIMQVLVVLAERTNEVVARDELIARCWQGRVVSDDALHRCIGRLRRIAEATQAFKIDTIHRVGFRLQIPNEQDMGIATAEPIRRKSSPRSLWALSAFAVLLIMVFAAFGLSVGGLRHAGQRLISSYKPYTGPASFTDCPNGCPTMVALPRGDLAVGPELARDPWGKPRVLTFRYNFAVSKFDVTRKDYALYLLETGQRPPQNCFSLTKAGEMVEGHGDWRNPGFPQSMNDPVVCVSWEDATGYVRWLAKKSGRPYRLLTEAEWLYASGDLRTLANQPGNRLCARLNGADESYHRAIPGDPLVERGCSDHFPYTSPVGSFPPNRFGLYDMLGDVWSWLQDCYTSQTETYPVDGSAFEATPCSDRSLRGGSWSDDLKKIRVFRRESGSPGDRYPTNGFRVARDLS